jgi:hypothetical protein
MDKLLLKALPAMDPTNTTQPAGGLDLSPNLLNTLIPGYSIISHFTSKFLGIDISLFVTIGALLLAATKGGKYLFDQLETAFRYLFLSSVYIDEGDDLFDMVMSWLDARETSSRHRNIPLRSPLAVRPLRLQEVVGALPASLRTLLRPPPALARRPALPAKPLAPPSRPAEHDVQLLHHPDVRRHAATRLPRPLATADQKLAPRHQSVRPRAQAPQHDDPPPYAARASALGRRVEQNGQQA